MQQHKIRLNSNVREVFLSRAIRSADSRYQALYSGVLEHDGMKLAVRLLTVFDGERARIEMLPANGTISIFALARRGKEAEILLPSALRGEHFEDLELFLARKLRTARFVNYLSAVLQGVLPADLHVDPAQEIVCGQDTCTFGSNDAEMFEVDRDSGVIRSAKFRDRFQLTDRVVFRLIGQDLLVEIPELDIRLTLHLDRRESLGEVSEKRFRLAVPENFAPLLAVR